MDDEEWYSPFTEERPASIGRRLLDWLLALTALLFFMMVFLVSGVWLLYQFGEAAVNLLRNLLGADD